MLTPQKGSPSAQIHVSALTGESLDASLAAATILNARPISCLVSYLALQMWKTGVKRQAAQVYGDWDDGLAWKEHEWSAASEDIRGAPIVVYVMLMMGYDDLELINPLGVKRGEQKQACCYASIGNLPPELRFNHLYMMMLMICKESLFDEDPTRVFAGADQNTGVPITSDWMSPGAQFRRGYHGHLVQVRLALRPCVATMPRFAAVVPRVTPMPRIATMPL